LLFLLCGHHGCFHGVKVTFVSIVPVSSQISGFQIVMEEGILNFSPDDFFDCCFLSSEKVSENTVLHSPISRAVDIL
jgi:hypothetical protein